MGDTPWGMIKARQEASKYRYGLGDAQTCITKALELLKKDPPEVKQALIVLEESIKRSHDIP